jgi:hypothetical protein
MDMTTLQARLDTTLEALGVKEQQRLALTVQRTEGADVDAQIDTIERDITLLCRDVEGLTERLDAAQ